MVSSGAAASTPGADVRLSNDAPTTAGYVSDYTLTTGQPYTDPTLTECSRPAWPGERTVGRGEPAQPAGHRGQLQRLLRDLQRRRRRERCTVTLRPDLAGLLPIPERWRIVPVLPGSRLPRRHLPVRVPGRRCGPRAQATRSWLGTVREDCSPGRKVPTTPSGSKKTFGDVWVATYENPQGIGGATINDGKEFRRRHRQPRILRTEPAGCFNDKTAIAADRTQPGHPGQRLLRLVPIHRQRRVEHLLRAGQLTTAPRSRTPR